MSSHGDNVDSLIVSNSNITTWPSRFKTAVNTTSSKQAKEKLAAILNSKSYNIVHVHNFFPLLTPSVYDACIEAGLPVVQTLHNFRTICPGALLLRNGKVCEKCIIGNPYQAMLYRCYRNSIPGSWAVARMVAYHRKRKTWQTKVDRFIALTNFSKQKFIEAGFPEHKIAVKPNFYNLKAGDRSQETGVGGRRSEIRGQRSEERQGALFVGRLSTEKGIGTLLSAWANLNFPLRIGGDGPLLDQYNKKHPASVEFMGRLSSEQVSQEMKQASFLVIPSEWYETFGLVIIEAFAHSLPVIAAHLGSMAEIVQDGVTGLHFEAGNPDDLATKVRWMHQHPEECRKMGEAAYQEYLAKYTPEKNYDMLMDVYRQAIAAHSAR